LAGYSDEVASPGDVDSARLRRDLSLALRRRLTVYAALGATALTVVFSLIAATTAPGKTKPAAQPTAQPDPTATSAPTFAPTVPPTAAPVVTQPPLARPTHAPRPVRNTPAPIVSGGS
jgi:hypothetical protein